MLTPGSGLACRAEPKHHEASGARKERRGPWVLEPRLRSEHRRSADFTDALLAELHAFRARFIRLKPGVAETEDFGKFSEFFRAGGNGILLRSAEGRLVGCVGYRLDHVVHRGRKHPVTWIEFLFVDREYRGHPVVSLAGVRVFLEAKRRYPWARTVRAFAIAFPASYLAITAHTPPRSRWSSRDRSVPAIDRKILAFCARHYLKEAYDPRTGLAATRTLPPDHPWGVDLSPVHRERLRAYEAMNPRWREGLGVPLVFPITARAFLGAAARRLFAKIGKNAKLEKTRAGRNA